MFLSKSCQRPEGKLSVDVQSISQKGKTPGLWYWDRADCHVCEVQEEPGIWMMINLFNITVREALL